VDRRAQQVLHLLGVEVLLEHLDLAVHPAVADAAIQRRHGVDDEALQAVARQALRQFGAQAVRLRAA
jgi:hypothetical protein